MILSNADRRSLGIQRRARRRADAPSTVAILALLLGLLAFFGAPLAWGQP